MVDYQTLSIVLTGTGMIIALTYYALQIRNQNRARKTQLFMNLYQKTVAHEFQKAYRKVSLTQWNNYEEFYRINDYRDTNHPDPEFIDSVNLISSYYEGMGVLIKENLFDIRLVALLMTGMTKSFWEKYAPYIEKWREDTELPRLWSETEYLYDELMKYVEEHPELKT